MNATFLEYLSDHCIKNTVKSNQFTEEWSKRKTIGASDINKLFVGFNTKFNDLIYTSQISLFKKLFDIREQNYEKFILFALGHFFEDFTREFIQFKFASSHLFSQEHQYVNKTHKNFTVTPDLILFAPTTDLIEFINQSTKSEESKQKLIKFINDKEKTHLKILCEFKYSVSNTGTFMPDEPFNHSYHLQYVPQIIFGQEHINNTDLGLYVRFHTIFSRVLKLGSLYQISTLYQYGRKVNKDKKITGFFTKKHNFEVNNHILYLQLIESKHIDYLESLHILNAFDQFKDKSNRNIVLLGINSFDHENIEQLTSVLYKLKQLSNNDAFITEFVEKTGTFIEESHIKSNVQYILDNTDFAEDTSYFLFLVFPNYSFTIDICDNSLISGSRREYLNEFLQVKNDLIKDFEHEKKESCIYSSNSVDEFTGKLKKLTDKVKLIATNFDERNIMYNMLKDTVISSNEEEIIC